MKKVILLLAVVFSINASAQEGITSWSVQSSTGAVVMDERDYESALTLQNPDGDAVMLMATGDVGAGTPVLIYLDGASFWTTSIGGMNGFTLLSWDISKEPYFNASYLIRYH